VRKLIDVPVARYRRLEVRVAVGTGGLSRKDPRAALGYDPRHRFVQDRMARLGQEALIPSSTVKKSAAAKAKNSST
jgi:hypothetical protein